MSFSHYYFLTESKRVRYQFGVVSLPVGELRRKGEGRGGEEREEKGRGGVGRGVGPESL
jgi:hypothetical protein